MNLRKKEWLGPDTELFRPATRKMWVVSGYFRIFH